MLKTAYRLFGFGWHAEFGVSGFCSIGDMGKVTIYAQTRLAMENDCSICEVLLMSLSVPQGEVRGGEGVVRVFC